MAKVYQVLTIILALTLNLAQPIPNPDSNPKPNPYSNRVATNSGACTLWNVIFWFCAFSCLAARRNCICAIRPWNNASGFVLNRVLASSSRLKHQRRGKAGNGSNGDIPPQALIYSIIDRSKWSHTHTPKLCADQVLLVGFFVDNWCNKVLQLWNIPACHRHCQCLTVQTVRSDHPPRYVGLKESGHRWKKLYNQ